MEKKYIFLFSAIILRNAILYYYFPNIVILLIINGIELLCLYLFASPFDNKKKKDQTLLSIIQSQNLKEFKDYVTLNKISPNELTKMIFIGGNFTPFTYSISEQSFEIFKYMIDFGVDLNYAPPNSLKPIIYACYYERIPFVKELLKYQNKYNIYEKCSQFKANCLELAVWRNKVEIVKLLLESGMKFSIGEYNKTICGSTLVPFSKVTMEVKRELMRNKIFENKICQFNLHDKILKKELRLKSLNTRPYILENYLMYS